MILLTSGIVLLVIATLILRRWRRGRSVHCGQCGFELRGLPMRTGRCPECGNELDLVRGLGIARGQRSRRGWQWALGMPLLMIALLLAIPSGWRLGRQVDFVTKSPTFVLVHTLPWIDSRPLQARMIYELMERDLQVSLSSSQRRAIAGVILDNYGTWPAKKFGPTQSFDDILAAWGEAWPSDDALWKQYYDRRLRLTLSPPDPLPPGAPLELDFELAWLSPTGATASKIAVDPKRCRVTIDGRDVPRYSADSVRVLDLAAMDPPLAAGEHQLTMQVDLDSHRLYGRRPPTPMHFKATMQFTLSEAAATRPASVPPPTTAPTPDLTPLPTTRPGVDALLDPAWLLGEWHEVNLPAGESGTFTATLLTARQLTLRYDHVGPAAHPRTWQATLNRVHAPKPSWETMLPDERFGPMLHTTVIIEKHHLWFTRANGSRSTFQVFLEGETLVIEFSDAIEERTHRFLR